MAGRASAAGLDPACLSRLVDGVAALPEGDRPWCAGVVVAAGRWSRLALVEAFGWAVRYRGHDPSTDRGVPAAPADRRPARTDTVFDLASLTKLCTAIVAVRQCERGVIDLDAEAGGYAPELTAATRHGLTVRELLTHTSGLRPELPLYAYADDQQRLARLAVERPLPERRGGHHYSDLNMLLLQRVLERATGARLDELVHDHITGPLGMADTRFRPPPSWRPRIAATEDQRLPWGKLDRGLLHGRVHDENAHALGGVAGHAGLFSTAADLSVLCRTLLAGGVWAGDPEDAVAPPGASAHGAPGGDTAPRARDGAGTPAVADAPDGRRGAVADRSEAVRILAPESVDALLDAPGLGFGVDQPWFMGELAGRGAAGHTGFTGTSVVLDRSTGCFLVLLANTVHPRRRPPDNGPRVAAANWLARAARR